MSNVTKNVESVNANFHVIRNNLNVLCEPGQVYELRVLKTKCGTVGGFYSDLDNLAQDAVELTNGDRRVSNKFGKLEKLDPARSVFLTVNPVNPDLAARAHNRVRVLENSESTSDSDVTRIRRLPLDFDPIRLAGISSSEPEHDAALNRARDVRDYLALRGFPLGLLGDSGNGGHLLYGLDLAVEDAELVKDFIHAMAKKFTDPSVNVDPTVFNPSRIWTLYGTWKRKGDSLPSRPHRLSRVVEGPDTLVPVDRALLERVVAELTTTKGVTLVVPDPATRAPTPRDFVEAVREDAGEVGDDWFKSYGGDLRTLDVAALWACRGLEIAETKPGEYRCECPRKDRHSDDKREGTWLAKKDGKFPVYRCGRTGCRDEFGKDGVKAVLAWFGREAVDAACGQPFKEGSGEKKVTVAGALVDMVKELAELFRDEDGTPFARVSVGGHKVPMKIKCEEFNTWLIGTWYERTGNVLKSDPIKAAVGLVEHLAKSAPQHRVYRRWAKVDDKVCLDLGNDDWDVVGITKAGWDIIENDPEVVFRRTSNTGSYPKPVRGGNLDALRPFFTGDDDNYVLWLGTILAAVAPGTYFVTFIHGEQGSGKSWACKFARRLVDPAAKVEITSAPKKIDENFVKVTQQRFANCWDNVSTITDEVSDFLCKSSSGGGLECRKLYTDDTTNAYNYQVPFWINGIPDLMERPDLADRAIGIRLQVLTAHADEEQLERDWKKAYPGILGGFLDAIVMGMRRWDQTPEEPHFRMGGSVRWVNACRGDDLFGKLYARNRAEAAQIAIDESRVAGLLIGYLNAPVEFDGAGKHYRGNATVLRDGLLEYARGRQIEIGSDFPKNSRALSAVLRRLTPVLRDRKIMLVDCDQRTNTSKIIDILSLNGVQDGTPLVACYKPTLVR